MNEEEKKAVEEIKELIKCFYCFPNPTSIELKDCYCSTLEIALNLIEKLQKENSMLKKVNKITENITTGDVERAIKEAEKQYIPIQKVKDKIEELEAQYKIALEENSTKAFILKCQITILQELLEGRK